MFCRPYQLRTLSQFNYLSVDQTSGRVVLADS
jgi:hypothetical protein